MKSEDPRPVNENRTVSIVIPVYNREDWVGAAIDSVLAQSCDRSRYDIVLVDDGSTDSSPQILDRYAAELPGTITVIHQPNGGVAAALNVGVAAATGDIVGFLGSDDYLSNDTVTSVLDFYDDHWHEVDLAAIKLEMVGSRTGPHWNNGRRFVRTRVIDVSEEWARPQMHGGGTFIKRQMFAELGYGFDPELFVTEDATLNTQVIMRKMAYGVIAGPTYYNRRYTEGSTSQVSNSHYRKEFYTVIPQHAYQRVFDDAIERFGEIPRYVQAKCAYDMVFRFRASTPALSEAEHAEYRETIRSLLKQISVFVLMKQNAVVEQRLNMLDLREDNDLAHRMRFRDGVFYLDGIRIYSFDPNITARHRPPSCVIRRLEIEGGSARIEGTMGAIRLTDAVSFELRVGDHSYPLDVQPPLVEGAPQLSHAVVNGERFSISVPFVPGDRMSVVVRVRTGSRRFFERPLRLVLGRHSRFSGNTRSEFSRRDGSRILRLSGPYSLSYHQLSPVRIMRAEVGFIRRALAAKAPVRALARRTLALAAKARTSDEIWLLADHKQEAGDNAESMFRYLAAHPETGVKPVLMLSRSAPNHAELARLGEVVEPDSRAYFRRYFQAAVVLNSAADEYMINPLGSDRMWLADLTPQTSVFLQHGVIKDDLSGWLSKDRKGFDVFVTSAERERDSIIHGSYGYDPDDVALVGLPRFDRLENDEQKLVVIAPTWRKILAGDLDAASGRNRPRDEFVDSEYFSRWQQLISHPRLNSTLADAGFTGVFALHPSHSAEIGKFRAGERIGIAAYPYDYRDFFRRGTVMVTDYSSVVFDFAYLRKPVVYLQPDREEFFGSHLYGQGYFSYDDDGFGPVEQTVEGAVDAIIAAVRAGGSMPHEYRRRADEFFAFDGGGSCHRLYEHIRRFQADQRSPR